jgi:hypothetical protein
MIEFTGTDLSGKKIEFTFEEIGTVYAGDDIVYIHGNPVRMSSVKVVNVSNNKPLLTPAKNMEGER